MVSQLINNNGNPAANQFVITQNGSAYFQSYRSVVAKIDKNDNLILSNDWDYSNTTRKHLYIFLAHNGYGHLSCKKDILKAIKNKEVILKNVDSLKVI